MNLKKFDKLLSEALMNFKKNENIQSFVLHNMGHYTSALINYKALSDLSLKFDFREDYWFKTENRFFIKFCDLYFDKLTVNPKLLSEELLQITKILKKSRQSGLIKKLPKVGVIESKNDFINFGEIIANALNEELINIAHSQVTVEHHKLNKFKNLLAAFKDFCITYPNSNKAKDLNGILKTRIRFLPFVTANSLDELKTHSLYFSAIYGLFTNTNSYTHGGAQFFGPIIGNSDFVDIMNIYKSWLDGKSIKEVPFLSHNSVSKSKADFSNTTPVLEVFGYCKIDHYPIINNTSFKEYQKYLELNDPKIIKSFDRIAEEILNYFESEISEEDKKYLEQNFDIFFKKSTNEFEPAVYPEKFASESIKQKLYSDSLSKSLDYKFKKISETISLPIKFDKSLAMFHLIIDSCLYVSKEVKKERANRSSDNDDSKRFWIYAPGEKAMMWDQFREENIMALGWSEMGDLSEIKDKIDFNTKYDQVFEPEGAATNNKKALWDFANVLKPDDIVFAKKGTRTLLGYGVVTSDYSFDETKGRFSHIKTVEWQTDKEVQLPDDMEDLVQKTLTDITKYEGYANELLNLFVENKSTKNLELFNKEESEVIEYTLEDALDDLFLEENEFKSILDSLEQKKNIILEGPPGVGKTFIAKKIAKAFMGADDESKIQLIQFHQSYAYEDFVQGFRPDGSGGFILKNGIFYDLCQKAKENIEEKYFMIIDEINRGNLSKIFGELLMLIEADKRGTDYPVSLTYSNTGEKFSIPENIYIIGTMNTADRSISMIDYALRRRFRFIQLKPQFNNPKYREFLVSAGVLLAIINRVISKMNEINGRIRQDKRRLGVGYEIGHSYFCPSQKGTFGEEWFNAVMKNEVLPLLKEYWFDDEKALEFLDEDSAA